MSSLTDQIGRVLAGRYRLVSPVGTGASAHVYAADDVVLSRRVAVKVLHPALVGDQAFLRRFRAEARAAASLNHPHVLRVFDWGEDADGPFLVLEYLGGGSLRDLLDAGHLLSPAQAALVGAQAAHGLAYAHRRGIVHRDVKPANILFDDEGSLRVADFGIARALAEAAWTEPTGAVLGTARYASPEQAEGRVVDDRADVYSLALVLFESVAGWVPFSADTTVATLMARLGAHLPMVPDLGLLGPILAQAAIPEPLARLDAAGLAVDLEILARDLDPPAPLPLAGPPRPWSRREQDPTLIGEPARPIDLTAASGAALAPPPAGPPRVPHRLPPAPRPPRQRPPDQRPPAAAEAAAPAPAPPRTTGAAPGPPALHPPAATAPLAPPGAAAPRHAARPVRPAPSGPRPRRPSRRQARATSTQAAGVAASRKRERRRPRLGLIVGAGIASVVVVLLLTAAGTGLAHYRRWAAAGHVVPELSGKPLGKAQGAAMAADLRVGISGERYDAGVPAGDVISQSVAPGARMDAGGLLWVVVSRGAAPVHVPRLGGDTAAQAEQAIQAAGLRPSQAPSQYSETVDNGKVIGWSPSSGLVRPGSTVSFWVSLGPRPRIVPNLSGWSWPDAQADLEGLRLVPQEQQIWSTKVKAGLVISTTPGPQSSVARGSPVVVVVSKGPQYVTIDPNIYGMSAAQARSVLAREGLPIGGTYGIGSTVIATEPVAGSRVQVGTPVFLYLF